MELFFSVTQQKLRYNLFDPMHFSACKTLALALPSMQLDRWQYSWTAKCFILEAAHEASRKDEKQTAEVLWAQGFPHLHKHLIRWLFGDFPDQIKKEFKDPTRHTLRHGSRSITVTILRIFMMRTSRLYRSSRTTIKDRRRKRNEKSIY